MYLNRIGTENNCSSKRRNRISRLEVVRVFAFLIHIPLSIGRHRDVERDLTYFAIHMVRYNEKKTATATIGCEVKQELLVLLQRNYPDCGLPRICLGNM